MEVKFIDGDLDKGGRFIWKSMVVTGDLNLKDLLLQLEKMSVRQARVYTEGNLYSLTCIGNPEK